ncbi:MAG: cytochrome c family protein, partial [Proteobacteria bacterium]|nr:cytochrome c family protein [Pseudomonadota bacterium]
SSPLNLNAMIKGDERLNESKLIRIRLDGIEVLQTPLGGQGVLKSTELQRIESELASSLKATGITSPTSSKVDCVTTGTVNSKAIGSHCAGTQLKFERSFVQWLGPEGAVDQGVDMSKLVDSYRSQSTERMKLLEQTRLADLESSKFIGSESCKSCHASSFEKWTKSKHSQAFSTLEKKSRTSDPECVSCHVVGFSEKGGFVSSSKTPHLLNVQCENCHGARKDHVESPITVRKGGLSAKDSCKNCHTPPHSPNYVYEKYWKIIEHK